jgi:cell division protein FtsZ
MIHFDLPKQKSSIIKVIGIGGGGSNAVNYMNAQEIEGVDFVVCNTDAKAIELSNVQNKIQLGPASTQGLGAGANPEVGKLATEESLQEIKSILEVNTRMAFITAGMGGGTGTGGAPIVAKICKELGILTVGIVTTPFAFEGPRRMQQAEEGIKALKPHVDTLLVISNDKLRMQYGNLKMKEAFSKADNVLATASKCITDIINSKGHIIVDFADVCTVMKNGGVAILGSAAEEGENRAEKAIVEALKSPLLNDSDIKGAKWILININSAEGEFECTMDEMDTINEYLRTQAGEHTDVIVGMGTDNTLEKKIGITIIATGFEHKDPFAKDNIVKIKKEEPKGEKIVLTLGEDIPEEKVVETPVVVQQQALLFDDQIDFEPQLVEFVPHYQFEMEATEVNYTTNDFDAQREEMLDARETEIFELELGSPEPEIMPYFGEGANDDSDEFGHTETMFNHEVNDETKDEEETVLPYHNFLSKPANIYSNHFVEESPKVNEVIEQQQPENVFELTIKETVVEDKVEEQVESKVEEFVPEVKLEINEVEEDIVEPIEMVFEITNKEVTSVTPEVTNIVLDNSEEEDQRKRALDRIQKLRNLSFNLNNTDDNSEFEHVPAYVRRNMELFGNTLATVEDFYSKVTVDKNDKNETFISTKNSFLDGQRPD